MRCWVLLVWFLGTIPAALGAPIGTSVHKLHHEWGPSVERFPISEGPNTPTPGPDHTVYGYLAFWADDMATVPWDHLSHLALFAANAQSDGTLSRTDRWGDITEALRYAETYDVQIHLTIVNFDTEELRVLLGDPAARSDLIRTLTDVVEETGVDGVNVDFEGVPSDRREEMVAFIRELSETVDEVVVATPAVDWSDAWDYAALTEYSDLFIMGYGYHWSGSTYAGPVDPLYGGTPWGKHSLEWTADDYLSSGANPDRVIMGLPLYGTRWPTADNEVPTPTLGSGTSVFWADAQREASIHGVSMEPVSQTPYFFDGSHQTWFGTAESVQRRVQRMIEIGLGGVGFWALNYDDGDAELWAGIYAQTHTDSSVDALEWVFDEVTLAYVGTEARISIVSDDPESVQFRWVQVSGPEVTVDTQDTDTLTFLVAQEGVYEFVVEGLIEGMTARSETLFVIGIDTTADPRLACGCHAWGVASGLSPFGWIVLSVVWLLRCRRGSASCER